MTIYIKVSKIHARQVAELAHSGGKISDDNSAEPLQDLALALVRINGMISVVPKHKEIFMV